MTTVGKFILMDAAEFYSWLMNRTIKRKIALVQLHHTYLPGYGEFKGDNHVKMLKSMEAFHVTQRKFSDIAQNITIFPDGIIAICRDLERAPAGIKGANQFGICIENIGNFDHGGDTMIEQQKMAIVQCLAILCKKFNLEATTANIVYHHWYDLNSGKRTGGTGSTKTCPGTNFFGGNTEEDAEKNLLPLVEYELGNL